MCGVPIRLNRMRSMALASVTVPTVDRGLAPIRSWSTRIAVVSPSNTSTSGRPIVGMKPCTNALYVSLINRCDSAAIVPNTSELFPDPETPVNTVSRRFGMSRLMSRRLFSRAARASMAPQACVGAARVGSRTFKCARFRARAAFAWVAIHRSARGFLDQVGDPLLDRGVQLDDRERRRPHLAVVELRVGLEADCRVADL